jgi:hypothetical protein
VGCVACCLVEDNCVMFALRQRDSCISLRSMIPVHYGCTAMTMMVYFNLSFVKVKR